MMRTAIAAMVISTVMIAGASAVQPTDSDQGAAQSEAPEPVHGGLRARLESLRPEDPEGYLLAGEEVLATERTQAGEALARRLFTLAYEHARLAGDRPGVQTTACIALADTTRFERDRRWLWSIVRLIDPRYNEPDWSRTVERVVSDEAAFRSAVALGLLRSGHGLRAREALRDDGVREVFDWYSGLLTGAGPGDVMTMLEGQAERWPCPECRNDRVVRRRDGGLDGPRVRCFTCRGNPGWELGERGMLSTLRFESRVLAGVQRSWGAQLAADLGEPLRDPDPAAVADAVGVDTALCVFRDGAWAEPTEHHPGGEPEPDPGG